MNKNLKIGLAVAVVGVGGYFLYKMKDRNDCKKFVTKMGQTSDFEDYFCKDKNWRNKPIQSINE